MLSVSRRRWTICCGDLLRQSSLNRFHLVSVYPPSYSSSSLFFLIDHAICKAPRACTGSTPGSISTITGAGIGGKRK